MVMVWLFQSYAAIMVWLLQSYAAVLALVLGSRAHAWASRQTAGLLSFAFGIPCEMDLRLDMGRVTCSSIPWMLT